MSDLSTALDFSDPDTRAPSLPRARQDDPAWGDHCPTSSDPAPFLESPVALHVPTGLSMPSQEAGEAMRRNCEPAA